MGHKIFIAGSGGIGTAAGLILQASDVLDTKVIMADRYASAAQSSANYINEGTDTNGATPLEMPSAGLSPELESALKSADIILDCLPGSQAPRLAGYAKTYGCHYANLTEYVKETDEVTEIAKGSDKGFILQTGLAPGYINVVAHHLFKKFCAKNGVDKVDAIDMRVGALSKNARAPYFYAYTWSPIGVATEYVKDAIVVKDYKTQYIPSLSKTETILLDGKTYEDDFTSGGAADLPKALAGKVKDLSYKTLRFPGHYAWAKEIIQNTPAGKDKVTHLNETMLSQIPAVEDDVVIVYASVKGADNKGTLRAEEATFHIYPSKVGKHTLRAIQTTTAGPLCEAARLLLTGDYSGPVFQSMIDTHSFLNGPFVKGIYGSVK